MKKILILFIVFVSLSASAQVQRAIAGTSFIRENIIANSEFHFFRDWSVIASFKSGIGESVEFFPIIFSVPNTKTETHGLQLDAEVKPRDNQMKNSVSGFRLKNKDFVKRSVFIDKTEVGKMIAYIERDIIPHLKDTYKNKSKEYVFKSKEMFFSFLMEI
jgi:hypothetical protein